MCVSENRIKKINGGANIWKVKCRSKKCVFGELENCRIAIFGSVTRTGDV